MLIMITKNDIVKSNCCFEHDANIFFQNFKSCIALSVLVVVNNGVYVSVMFRHFL